MSTLVIIYKISRCDIYTLETTYYAAVSHACAVQNRTHLTQVILWKMPHWFPPTLPTSTAITQSEQHLLTISATHTILTHTKMLSNKSSCDHQRQEVPPPDSNFATTTNRHGYTYPDPTTRITRHSRALLDLGREEPTTWSANPTHMTIDPYQTRGVFIRSDAPSSPLRPQRGICI